MLRKTASRSLRSPVLKLATSRSSYITATTKTHNVLFSPQLRNPRSQFLVTFPRLTTTTLLYATTAKPPIDKIDRDSEKKVSEQQIQPHPDQVSTGSSVRHVFESGQDSGKDTEDMLGGIKADLQTIKETFALNEVPRESYYIGAAGVIPYAATSLSTVYLAYDINNAVSGTGMGVFFSQETAQQLLEYLTPIQIGYGAVVS